MASNSAFKQAAIAMIVFCVVMVGMTVLCAVLWKQFLVGNVYDNTDDGDGGGYLFPGHWVGNDEGFPVIVVEHLKPVRSMSDPDELKAGWSVTRLWFVWWFLLGISTIVSASLSVLVTKCSRHTPKDGLLLSSRAS